jgi:hypothetical protein
MAVEGLHSHSHSHFLFPFLSYSHIHCTFVFYISLWSSRILRAYLFGFICEWRLSIPDLHVVLAVDFQEWNPRPWWVVPVIMSRRDAGNQVPASRVNCQSLLKMQGGLQGQLRELVRLHNTTNPITNPLGIPGDRNSPADCPRALTLPHRIEVSLIWRPRS